MRKWENYSEFVLSFIYAYKIVIVQQIFSILVRSLIGCSWSGVLDDVVGPDCMKLCRCLQGWWIVSDHLEASSFYEAWGICIGSYCLYLYGEELVPLHVRVIKLVFFPLLCWSELRSSVGSVLIAGPVHNSHTCCWIWPLYNALRQHIPSTLTTRYICFKVDWETIVQLLSPTLR